MEIGGKEFTKVRESIEVKVSFQVCSDGWELEFQESG